MSVPANILQQVITYQESSLAYLSNYGCFTSTSNAKFKNFQDLTANLGDTVSFDLPTRFTSTNSLVANFQSAEQRIHNLTVDKQISTAFAFTAQQFIFNVEDYMSKFGMGATAEIGTEIESNIAENAITGPFRFYGNGLTPITSVDQIAEALANFRTFGMPKVETKGYLQDLSVSKMVTNALNQFVLDRNEKMANSWEVGAYDACDFYKSNLLALHTAGTVGQAQTTLTVVSVVKNSEGGITSIVFSGGPTSDASAVLLNDKFEFQDGVSGKPNVRFLTFIGHKPSAAHVQFRATATAGSTGGGQVTVNIYPPLQAASGKNQNLTTDIVAGMQVKALPNHRAGLITAGNPLYLAMPRLPEQVPFPTANASDPDMGISMRMTYGSALGENRMGFVYDAIWGSTLVPEYSMMIAYPE
jgi:hypothetical protein